MMRYRRAEILWQRLRLEQTSFVCEVPDSLKDFSAREALGLWGPHKTLDAILELVYTRVPVLPREAQYLWIKLLDELTKFGQPQ
jgi:hypothetical protein